MAMGRTLRPVAISSAPIPLRHYPVSGDETTIFPSTDPSLNLHAFTLTHHVLLSNGPCSVLGNNELLPASLHFITLSSFENITFFTLGFLDLDYLQLPSFRNSYSSKQQLLTWLFSRCRQHKTKHKRIKIKNLTFSGLNVVTNQLLIFF